MTMELSLRELVLLHTVILAQLASLATTSDCYRELLVIATRLDLAIKTWKQSSKAQLRVTCPRCGLITEIEDWPKIYKVLEKDIRCAMCNTVLLSSSKSQTE